MNTYQKIKALLELNTLKGVAVKFKNGNWKVFTHINGEENLEGTSQEKTIEDCLKDSLAYTSYSKEEIERNLTSEIIPIPQKPKVLPAGTKVRILPIARECGNYADWSSEKNDMVDNGIYEIKEPFDDGYGVYYRVFTKDKANWWHFPAYAVVPAFEEEIEELTMAQICERLGKKVKIIK